MRLRIQYCIITFVITLLLLNMRRFNSSITTSGLEEKETPSTINEVHYLMDSQEHILDLSSMEQSQMENAPNTSALHKATSEENCAKLTKTSYLTPARQSNSSIFQKIAEGTYAYSAFYDSRNQDKAIVRVVGLANFGGPVSKLSCILWYRNGSFYRTAAVTERLQPRLLLQNPSSTFVCESPPGQPPHHLTLKQCSDTNDHATLEVLNRNQNVTVKYNLTVCVHAALYGDFPSSKTLVEFIEIYRLLGAGKIVIYNYTSHANLEKVLTYYKNKGILDLQQWPLPKTVNTHYHAQDAVIEDCLYRYMYESEYTAFVNLDEIFIPRKYSSLIELINHLNCSKPGQIIFSPAVFPMSVEKNRLVTENKSLDALESVIFSYTIKNSENDPVRTKVIVKPRNVIEIGIHECRTLVSGAKSCHVPESDALLHHYRFKWAVNKPTDDPTALRFLDQMYPQLKKTHSEIGINDDSE